MVKLTLIARVSDGLPLAEGLDNDKDHELSNFKQQAKVGVARCVRLHVLPWRVEGAGSAACAAVTAVMAEPCRSPQWGTGPHSE